ncbi:MAG: glycosyltransferase [Planctomycetales bacterium]|nr:glycosyltransferase [Planctomycetales bacterium]
MPRRTRVAVTYRVIWHWRLPIFQRLAADPAYEMCVFHGADFPGTKTVNAKRIEGVPHRQLFTLRFLSRMGLPEWPLCPTLIWRLWRFRPDVILAEGNSNLVNNILTFCYATLTRTPVVFWTLGELKGEQKQGIVNRVYRRVTRWMEQHSAALLGYSSRALDYFQRNGYPTEKQFRAVNVVDTDAIPPRVAAAADQVGPLRTSLKLDDKQVVLFVGAIIPQKRMEDLVDAFEIVRRAQPNSHLLIVGDGPYLPTLREYIAKSEARADVSTVGKVVEGVSAYFLLGDVLVLPHLGGLAISEALAHGIPVIATNADGCEEDLIVDGYDGYLVPVGQPTALADRILSLLSDPQLLAEMKTNALQMIAERHNVHTYLGGIKDAIDYAAKKNASH